MSQTEELAGFVREALKGGLSRDEIRSALQAAGWTETEAEAALAGWSDAMTPVGPVPRPVRSSAAREAFFYALLFVTFGMVTGNVLGLLFGQINIWLPEPDRLMQGSASGLRWSMAALIVFTPVFWALQRADARGLRADPARRHGTIRRWLSSLALLIAVITLLSDALFLIYTFLDGQMTARFLAKSAVVAGISGIVLAFFRQEREGATRPMAAAAGWAIIALSLLALGLSFATIGGPGQGQAERRDRARLADLRVLSNEVRDCEALAQDSLPETLDPMSCARNPQALTGFAAAVEYRRSGENSFELCTGVEAPAAVSRYDVTLEDGTACMRTYIDRR